MSTPGDDVGGSVASERVPSSDGVRLALHDLGGVGPALLLCHPTGFHGLIWAPVAAALREVARCWALDFRGHGDSSLAASGRQDWGGMADDVLAVVDRLGAERIHGVGHSMGAAALLLAEQARPGTWAALWGYEPIVFPRLDGAAAATPLAEAARRRKAVFPDRETARRNYASKPPLSVLDPAALEAYVAHGLRDRPDGTVELKCAPETEARTFEGGLAHDAFARLGSVACPTVIAASGDQAPPALVAPVVAEALPHGRLERFPRLTHFGPMQEPATIAASIRRILPAG